MLDLRKQTSKFEESKPFHTLINVAAFVSRRHFITKTFDVGVVIKYESPDVECAEPERIDALTSQLTSACRAFGEDVVVTNYLVKSSHPDLSAPVYQNPVLNQAVQGRIEFLKKRGARLFSFEGYLAVVVKSKWASPSIRERLKAWARSPRKALRQSLRVEDRAAVLDETVAASIKALDRAVDSFLEQSAGALSARVLDKHETFQFIRRLANPRREKATAVSLGHDRHVDYFLADSELECHRDHLRSDGSFIKTLTLKRPPAHTFAQILRNLHHVQSEMVVVTEWNLKEPSRAVADIRSQRRHWHNTKTSLRSQVGSERPYESQILVDTAKQGNVDELGACLRDIELNGVQIGSFSLTVVLTAHSLEAAERAAAEVMKVFGAHDGALNEERYNGLNAFMASLPGGYPFNLRQLLVTNQNHSDMCSWFLPSDGERRNEFLKREPLIALETEDRSLLFYNLHDGDVGHHAMFGATGSGKSFALNCFITHVQAYDPFTFIFGLGGDYRWLTECFGGSYLRCTPERQPFRLNPFSLPPTAKNLEFCFTFTKLLVESRDFRMTDNDERETFEAIRSLYVLAPAQRRLLTLSTTVSKRVGDHLRRWTEGEQYGSWFDHAEDTLTYQRFQYVDFEGMERMGPVLEALLFLLLHRTNDVIYDEASRTTLKVFFIDEAWRFFRHEVTRAYITEALKTWRKKNASMILATQSVEDLAKADVLRPVIESCPTKILLANPTTNPQLYGEVLGLTATEQEKVKRLIPKQQFLLKREKLSKVLNLNVDPRSYWLFTTNPFEAKRREELVDQFGLSEALDRLSQESSH